MKRCLALILLLWSAPALADDAWLRLARTLEKDTSYKVRMQAARVMVKRYKKTKVAPPAAVVSSLEKAALQDEHELVRGMACVALGRMGVVGAKATLTRAKQDKVPFVRAQAEDALARLPKAPPPAPPPPPATNDPTPRPPPNSVVRQQNATGPTLALSIDAEPAKLQDSFHTKFQSALVKQGLPSATPAKETRGEGHHLKTILRARSAGASAYEVEVRVVIATWPANNLRHVVKATARVPVAEAEVTSNLMDQLLEATAQRAAQDVLSKIGGAQ